jgi:hypothetical protein
MNAIRVLTVVFFFLLPNVFRNNDQCMIRDEILTEFWKDPYGSVSFASVEN